ncbi:MAG: nicotinate-nucleotide adenylyltransferase [Chloroflexi bacterium]|nr:nicotinate-nucleotide adenylyltransferase [Chloroflexota bacterium]
MAGEHRGVGILGGTFDPLHLGHLIIAEEARTQLRLQEVIFVPAGRPYHRARLPVADTASRLAMVRLGVASNPAFRVSMVDIERTGPSYSVDTVQDLRQELGEGVPLFFIMGWDALRELHSWHRPDLLADLCRIVAVRRPGVAEADWAVLERAVPRARERILQLDMPLIGISATDIRRRVAHGLSIRYWVPDPVSAHIAAHGLYRPLSPQD